MTDLLHTVERYLTKTGMAASAFGRMAMDDPRFVYDLRQGRTVRAEARARTLKFIEGNPEKPPARRARLWTPQRDEALWELVGSGMTKANIAANLGVTRQAAHARINQLADIRLPFRPHGARLSALIRNQASRPDLSGSNLSE